MNQELDEVLVRDFPNVFRQRHGDKRETAMCWGFSHGDGWEKIVREGAALIEKEILKIPEDQREYICASQVKEKFGGLRFYMHGTTDEIDFIIEEMMRKSYITCEECGQSGKTRGDLGWISTLCNDHYLERLTNLIIDNCLRHATMITKKNYKGEEYQKISLEDNTYRDKLKTRLQNLLYPIKEKTSFKNRFESIWYRRWRLNPKYWDLKRSLITKYKYIKWKYFNG